MSKISKERAYTILVEKCKKELLNLENTSFKRNACGSDHEPGSRWTLDGQCMERFGKNWDEIRRQVFLDLESISRWHTPTKDFGGACDDGLHSNSGHWMINGLLNVHSFKRAWERFNGDIPRFYKFPKDDIKKLVKTIRNGYEPTLGDIITISPQLANKELELMLKSHDLI